MVAAMDPESITRRLQEVGRLSDLRTERRLEGKVPMTPEAIDQRMRTVSKLRDLCLRLGEIGKANGLW